MALLPLDFPPGIYRNGTERQSKNRYFDCNLIRFYEGTKRPIGGWRKKSITGTLTNPFTTVSFNHVTVAHTAHGLRVGDALAYANATTVGGLNMNGSWVVASVPDANTYTFDHTDQASYMPTGSGGTVNYSYAQLLTGSNRAIITWKDNSVVTWAGLGTHSHLYAMGRTGALYDITPAGFTSGRASSSAAGGYGSGAYGASTYGTPRADSTLIQDASVWTLDTFGQYLVGCMADDGKLYEWQLVTGTPAAAITNAPTGCRAVFVTEERIMVALGAESVPRRVKWCDAEADTVWTPAATNQAGDFDLQTAGRLMMGKKVRGGNLVWTDLDVHLMTYTADILVYSFNKLAEGCGAISQNCAAVLTASTVWMGSKGFWLWNGFVQPLPCEVSDYVFSDINANQLSKVTCWHNSVFGEVTWHYPSSGSNENDRYVTYSYRERHWTIGSTLARLAGIDRGTFLYPLLAGSDGYTYEHEVGFSYDGQYPFLESGPFEGGNGDNVMHALQLIPDEKTSGDVTATFKVKFYPNGPETSFGPYTLSASTDVRFCGRQTKVRYTGSQLADWRVGAPRLDLKQGGGR